MKVFVPLMRSNLHGSYVDDALFGVIFLIMLAVFVYFYFTGGNEEESERKNDK